MVQRLTYRRRHSYNTTSNKVKIVRTPGGKLTFQYRTKAAKGPRCGVAGCNVSLAGIPHLRPIEYKNSRLSKRQKTVTRAYGGSLCSVCVRDRIVRAFLIEEQKIVKKLVQKQEAKSKAQAAAKAEKDAAAKKQEKSAAASGKGAKKGQDAKKGGKQQGGDKKPQGGKPQGGARKAGGQGPKPQGGKPQGGAQGKPQGGKPQPKKN